MHIIFVALLLTLTQLTIESKVPDTISLNFERKVMQGNSTEIVKGIAYYQSPQKLFIEVKHPINQIMIIDGGVMLIYYPLEKKAIRYKTRNQIPIPFIQTMLSIIKDDYGLTEMGYTLKKHKTEGDNLYTYWEPPRELRKRLGSFILGTANGRLVYVEAKNPKGKTVAKSFYEKYIELMGKNIPMEIHTDIYNEGKIKAEDVAYSKVKLNVALPEEVVNFKLPESISVKEIEW